jgi:hypothetical protein
MVAAATSTGNARRRAAIGGRHEAAPPRERGGSPLARAGGRRDPAAAGAAHPRSATPLRDRREPHAGCADLRHRARRRAHVPRLGRRELRDRRHRYVHRVRLHRPAHRRQPLPAAVAEPARTRRRRSARVRRELRLPPPALADRDLLRRSAHVADGADRVLGVLRAHGLRVARPRVQAAAQRASPREGRRVGRGPAPPPGDHRAPLRHRGPGR